mgnify:CR=1 FL=1|tara:strand:- start:4195 stop:6006 length:1812 start_codon:yes stop_codon:yes gene_type:complete
MECVFDIETDGLNPTKIHCMVIDGVAITDYQEMRDCLNKVSTLVGHNIIRYDIPVLERLLNITIKATLVDTLALSWYLYPTRTRHGLAVWGEDFGISKPTVDDWENLPLEEYVNRCKEDVRINILLWKLQKGDLEALYDGKYNDLVEYLTFKMTCAKGQEEEKWKFNEVQGEELLSLMIERQDIAKDTLHSVMPEVPKYSKKVRPKEPFKMDGTLSVVGLRWKELVEERNLGFDYQGEVQVFQKNLPPNASSSKQIKDWLFALGWIPATYNFVEDRQVPQIKNSSGLLCSSIENMIKDHPELASLSDLGVLGHRIGIVKGFLESARKGYVVAGIQGLTNTLRFKHKTCVNIPSLRKPYGEEIRSLLTVRKDTNELVGSDMCSLEDRTKQHYMWNHDADYVKEMMVEGFDPHLDIAVAANMMTQEQANQYKKGGKTEALDKIRYNAKTANYASTYGAGAATIARQAGMSEKEARKLHKAYWERNWSVKAIAEESVVKVVKGKTWLYNPVSKFWYFLKADKDKFSTLNQGTGTFLFDMWVKELKKGGVRILGQFHDEVIAEVKQGQQEKVKEYFKLAVQEVNNKFSLNRVLDVDVQFGKNYAGIH